MEQYAGSYAPIVRLGGGWEGAEGNKVFPGFTHDTVPASPFQLGRATTEHSEVYLDSSTTTTTTTTTRIRGPFFWFTL